MKIIRVASSDQLTGLFSNEFSEAITLPPRLGHSTVMEVGVVESVIEVCAVYAPLIACKGVGSPSYPSTVRIFSLILTVTMVLFNFVPPTKLSSRWRTVGNG